MKKVFFSILTAGALFFTACSDADEKPSESHDMSDMKKEPAQDNSNNETPAVSEISATYTNLDPKVSGDLKLIVDHYLHIKNALANDNGKEAASGGKAMAEVMGKLDKSLIAADQRKVYDENEEDLKEHAEHIDKNANNIEHQREHFVLMSGDVYALVKAYGAGKTLYHDHCPMYDNNKGAMWLSETPEIKNPYYGSKMPKCGKVQEKLN